MDGTPHRLGRWLLASLLALAFLGLGLLAPYVPNVIPYVSFGWALIAYLLAVGCFSMGFRRPTMRFLAALVAGFFVLHTYPYFIAYYVITDQMAPQFSTGPANPPAFLGLLGGFLSYLPAFHCLCLERKLAVAGELTWPQRVRRGMQIGLVQVGKVLLLMAPLLFLAPVALAAAFAVGPPALLPPGVVQYFFFLISTLMAILAAATASGAAAGLILSLAPALEKTPPPPEDIADLLDPGPERSHLGGLTEVIRHR